MTSINLIKFPVSSPADTSPLSSLQAAGYSSSQILGVVGKSEGNGCVNDFSRTLSAHAWESLIPSSAITIFSGGTEGILCPHVTFIVSSPIPTGLVASVGRTRRLEGHEVGTTMQATVVRDTVREMMKNAGIVDEQHVKMVLIKCPLLTSERIAAIKKAGGYPVTEDTYESMARSRFACAVGIAGAMNEIDDDLNAAMHAEGGKVWTSKASCSSGAELEDCHILLLASSSTSVKEPRQLRAISTSMASAIDAPTILSTLQQITSENGKIVQVFVKAEADPSGLIQGKWRHTMNTDSDVQSTRHARAAVGGLVAGLVGDAAVYVSGGAEGQGPAGGGSLCIVYEVGV